jgi:glutamate--cysteine ligase
MKDKADNPVIESRDQLVADLETGNKPKRDWRIGTEHEKFGFLTDTMSPLPYDGERSVAAVLQGLADQFTWLPVMEGDHVIGLYCPDSGGSVSLEPGGQFELSGAPLNNLHETCQEVNTHLDQVRAVSEHLGIAFFGLGFSPKWTLAETPLMPKGRYEIMRDYMAQKGACGRDMMYRSATVQVNLDFSSQADMVKKFRVALALQPIATALFANSPFKEGRPNGYRSFRSELWRDTDPDRTGMLPFVFEDGFGFEAYVDYALDVPMYFVKRADKYHNAAGSSFRDFMAGKLDILPGERATMKDWGDHLTTLFPEVRLKYFLEMRGADGGPWRSLCALPALWVGLLYDQSALDAAWDMVKDWTAEERQALRDQVPATALKTGFRNTDVQTLAKQTVAIAKQGLEARNITDQTGRTEAHFLDVVEQVAQSGITPADELLEKFETEWHGDIDKAIAATTY